jgi:predicted methyltransferase
MKRALLTCAAAIVALCSAPLAAGPRENAAAVADPARPAAARAMDEGRMPAAVLDFAGYKAGDVIADYQAGGGYYTELLARVVGPKGRVYAVSQPNFWEADTWNPLLKRRPNVLPLVAPGDALQLAPRSVDSIFAHLVYHDLYWVSDKFEHPRLDVDGVVRGWFAAVKPGGSVVIIDHAANPGDPRVTVEQLHRIDPAVVRADMERAGFVLEATSDLLHRSEDGRTVGVFDQSVRGKTDRFVMRFRKPA